MRKRSFAFVIICIYPFKVCMYICFACTHTPVYVYCPSLGPLWRTVENNFLLSAGKNL